MPTDGRCPDDDVAAADAMEVDADGDAPAPAAAAAPRETPSFASAIAATLPAALVNEVTALEALTMAGYTRNGPPFESYFRRWDLMIHTARSASGVLLGAAISGAEGRGKVFLYELHVAEEARGVGVGRALIDLAERSSTSRGRGGVMMELNVHTSNVKAQGFYEHLGFTRMGETRDKLAIIMRRKR